MKAASGFSGPTRRPRYCVHMSGEKVSGDFARPTLFPGLGDDALEIAMPLGQPGREALDNVHERVMSDLSARHPGTIWRVVPKEVEPRR